MDWLLLPSRLLPWKVKYTYLSDLNLGILEMERAMRLKGFPCGSASKESACNAGDLGSIPGLGRCPGEGKGYPLQTGLENSMDCIVYGVTKNQT